MKKTLLLSLILGVSAVAYADAPIYQWSKLIDSPKQQDMTSDVVVLADGSPVSFSHFGSVTAEDGIEFDGMPIATGAATNGSSDNRNLLIIKHDAATGARIWNIYSKEGYVDVSSEGSVMASADGGLVVLLNARSAQVTPYTSPVIVDATGAEIEFPEWNTSEWVYNQVLVKIDGTGRVEWAKSIAQDQLPVPYATSGNSVSVTTNGVSPYALAEDAEGNIYIGGNYRSSMVLTAALNATYVFTPRNLEHYNGDSQIVAGGLYLIRLDKDGNYLGHLRASGTLTRDQINKITVSGFKLYFCGNVKGDKDDVLTIGSQSITIENSYDGILVGAASTDLKSVDFLTYIKPHLVSGKTSNTTKIRGLDMYGTSLYIYGGGQGGYSPAGEDVARVASTAGMEQGWIIRLDTADGSWQGAVNNATQVGAYLGSYEYKGSLYFYGYALNAATGCFVDEYTAGNISARAARHNVVLGGGAPTGRGMAFDVNSTRVYFCARGNNAFKVGADGVETDKPASWGGLLCGFVMDPSLVGINAVTEDFGQLSVVGGNGTITVTTDTETPFVVTDLKGINIITTRVQEGTTEFQLPAGIYIAAGQKVAVI